GFQTANPLVIENIGNVNLSVWLVSDVNSSNATFLGGGNSFFWWAIGDNETGSCASGLSSTSYVEVNTTSHPDYNPVSSPGSLICRDLLWQANTDSLRVNVSIGIDPALVGTISGQRNATFIATGMKSGT
ncbi:MAG: hypothetical protein QXG00_03965, partial [Candidatus Woesearchaeota archaeon]